MPTTNVLELINQRYTVRCFEDELVAEEQAEKLLDAAMDAPSKQDKYPYRIYVLNNRSDEARQKREKLVEYTSCSIDLAGFQTKFYQNEIRTAPLSFLMTIKPVAEDWECGSYHERAATMRSTRDAMMPTIFMLLQAQEFGLGTACTGCFETGINKIDAFRKDFGMSDDEFPCIVLNVGKAKPVSHEENAQKIPRRIDITGEVLMAKELHYIDESDPSKGVYAAYNRGLTKKKQPEGLMKVF